MERLQKAFEALGKRARTQTCEAINGLIEEGEEVIEEFPEGNGARCRYPGECPGSRAL
jgi:ferritin-like metal-binding protein YciE